ncbi:MAG: disulfide bond formation protein B [Oceanospirillales bacterium]|uniref:Thiol:disulfide interchange protein DsbB n=1 Tax=Marinobacterium halophilum TaxID=267374 RepID=A0A2P8EXL7_9GAMM|nr:disulfide bond formation protein B [Marinobacterium halophilum]MBR9827192.1 disulfide bond formation protein B [Oceanospirillales bacterium]PSL14165.1 thiol:disulfide interchange protein DsbB [Marinobacterium halophilum]
MFSLQLLGSRIYWLVLLIGALLAESVALYFQYVLDYGPCVLCIHIRLWLFALILVALAALLTPRCPKAQTGCHLLTLIIALGFSERSWRTLATERTWIESACSLDSGLPTWFTPELWWPWMFEIWESCGYTPEVFAGFTMAELLAVAGSLFVVLAAAAMGANLVKKTAHN